VPLFSKAERFGFVDSSARGCHVAHLDGDLEQEKDDFAWMVGAEDLVEGKSFDGQISLKELPELLVDPASLLLSVVNSDENRRKSFNISVMGNCLPVLGRDGGQLEAGRSKAENGDVFDCVTFVLVLKPMCMADVCFLSALPGTDQTAGDLFSDVKFCKLPRPPPATEDVPLLLFPLEGNASGYLCSQGHGGHFTHYFPANYFAVDLDCEQGTNVVAVGDGVVTNIRQHETVEGIHSSNLFHWNSLQIRLSSGLFVEYVHIQTNSAVVKIGDKVKAGQPICKSGSVGFSPTPHLHLQLTSSDSDIAPTLPFKLLCTDQTNPDLVEPQILKPGHIYLCTSSGTQGKPT